MEDHPHVEESQISDDDRVLSLVQVMALSVLLGISGGAMAKSLGLGWGASLLVAWGATTLGVFAVTGVIMLAEWVFFAQAREQAKLVEAWEDDAWADAQAQAAQAVHEPLYARSEA